MFDTLAHLHDVLVKVEYQLMRSSQGHGIEEMWMVLLLEGNLVLNTFSNRLLSRTWHMAVVSLPRF